MLLENTDRELNILPHIGENINQPDNTPLTPAAQAAILDPDIVARYGHDERGSRGALAHNPATGTAAAVAQRSNIDSFRRWIRMLEDSGEIGRYFPRNQNEPASDASTRRAVLVTHSGFLHHNFGVAAQNNDIVYVVYNPASDELWTTIQLISRYDLNPARRRELAGCARVPPAGGGKKLKSRRHRKGKSPGRSSRKYGRH
jgi:hypothetical protein